VPDHPTRSDIALTDGRWYETHPHQAYAWMRANAPVYFDETGGVWGIANHADVKAISKQPERFSNSGGIRPDAGAMPMMIDMDDPAHWSRRKLVNRGFTPRRVRDSEPAVRAACTEILDAVCERGEADLVRDIAAPLPMIMIGDALGVAPEDRADLLRWSDDMVTSQSGGADDEAFIRAGEAFAAYQHYATRIIAERRAEPRDDLMSILVDAEVDGDRLSDEEIIWESLLILVGGDETTRHVISEGVLALLRNPDQLADLRADPALLPGAVEEFLRWVTPIKNMCRTVMADTTFGGQRLLAGQKLMLLYHSANFDESVFDNPMRFDIRRSPNDHVAFGFGSHFCLGNSLARLEIRVMLEELLTRLPDLRLTDPDATVPFRPATFITGPEHIPVTFTPSARS
jgi:cytochrome P450 family 142 subfamily A polypeptide 1